uniref:Uncharacterized protein n=1 Tax=Klebsiella pneumoniae TaxID=573 RepID=A0A3G4RJ97_KLEPN|nr:hypothetical protein [Klebsiella pneumoniae]QIM13749.1 hypothetical protein [Klebsiella pneumoniae]
MPCFTLTGSAPGRKGDRMPLYTFTDSAPGRKGDGICRDIPLPAAFRGAKVMGFAVLYPYRQRSGAQR